MCRKRWEIFLNFLRGSVFKKNGSKQDVLSSKNMALTHPPIVKTMIVTRKRGVAIMGTARGVLGTYLTVCVCVCVCHWN